MKNLTRITSLFLIIGVTLLLSLGSSITIIKATTSPTGPNETNEAIRDWINNWNNKTNNTTTTNSNTSTGSSQSNTSSSTNTNTSKPSTSASKPSTSTNTPSTNTSTSTSTPSTSPSKPSTSTSTSKPNTSTSTPSTNTTVPKTTSTPSTATTSTNKTETVSPTSKQTISPSKVTTSPKLISEEKNNVTSPIKEETPDTSSSNDLKFQFIDSVNNNILSDVDILVYDENDIVIGNPSKNQNSTGDTIYVVNNLANYINYHFTATKSGYENISGTIDNSTDFNNIKTISMIGTNSNSIKFQVKDSVTSNVLSDIRIYLYDSKNNSQVGIMKESLDSKNNPVYTIDNLSTSSNYRYSATKDGYINSDGNIDTSVDFSTLKSISITPIVGNNISSTGSVTLSLNDKKGNSISNANIVLIDSKENTIATLVYNKNTKLWETSNIEPGDYNLNITVSGDSKSFTEDLKVVAGQTTSLIGKYTGKTISADSSLNNSDGSDSYIEILPYTGGGLWEYYLLLSLILVLIGKLITYKKNTIIAIT